MIREEEEGGRGGVISGEGGGRRWSRGYLSSVTLGDQLRCLCWLSAARPSHFLPLLPPSPQVHGLALLAPLPAPPHPSGTSFWLSAAGPRWLS